MSDSFFYGASEHRINAKGQVAYPARFRVRAEGEESGVVLVCGEETCLYCYTHRQFQVVVDRLMEDEEVRGDADFLRDFFEAVYAVEFDSQGRIVIPALLREQGALTGRDVTFIGHRDRVELWDSALRSERRSASEKDSGRKRERLARRIFGA
ncbi:MAG: division/cell wall cluster transcriptional repressor MraZ [Planctomycetota bacterium]